MQKLRFAAIVAVLFTVLPRIAVSQPQQNPPGKVQEVAPEQAMAILGQQVADASGKAIGRLVDMLVDASGAPQAAVIDFGGFLGVGSRRIAVHWSALHFAPGERKRAITLDLTPDQIRDAPEYTGGTGAAPVVAPIAKPAPVVTAPDATAPAAATPPATPAPPAAAPGPPAESGAQGR